jgi:glutathione S-transferase
VPALQLDDGRVLAGVGVICQYPADQAPASKLVPAFGGFERCEQMAALNFASAEVHQQIGAPFNPKLTPEMKEVQVAAWTSPGMRPGFFHDAGAGGMNMFRR